VDRFAVRSALAWIDRDGRVTTIALHSTLATCEVTPRSDVLTITFEPDGPHGRFEFYDDEGGLTCPGPDRSAEATLARLRIGSIVSGRLRASVVARSDDLELAGEFEAVVCPE
jgi:hypothetical protein